MLLTVAAISALVAIVPVECGKILQTYQYPPTGIGKADKLVTFEVLYENKESFKTEWSLQKTNFLISTHKILDYGRVMRNRMGNKTWKETVTFVAKLNDTGIYTFSMIDPFTYTMVLSTSFHLHIVSPPKAFLLEFGKGEDNQYGQMYHFTCIAKGVPIPTIIWEMQYCLAGYYKCDIHNWTTIAPAKVVQTNGSYHTTERVSIKASEVGNIRCKAYNVEGSNVSRSSEIHFAMAISPQRCNVAESVVGDYFNLTCKVSKYPPVKEIIWAKSDNGTHLPLLRLNFTVQQISNQTDFKSLGQSLILQFANVSKYDIGEYTCITTDVNGRRLTQYVYVDVVDAKSRNKSVTIEYTDGEDVILICTVGNRPVPTVWYKGNEVVNISSDNPTVKNSELQFKPAYKADVGEYTCEVTSETCSYVKSFELVLKPRKVNILIPVVATAIVTVLLALIIALTRMQIVNSRRKKQFIMLEYELLHTDLDVTLPLLPVAEILSKGYCIKANYRFCLTADKLIIDRRNANKYILGVGNFGLVQQVGLKKSDGSVDQVALKRVKNTFDVDQYRMLYREMCLMTHLDQHPNIVNLIGIVTNISQRQLYMVMELCANGSLSTYLKSKYRQCEMYSQTLKRNYYNVEMKANWPLLKSEDENVSFHSQLLSYAYQVASGLEYLASLQFVHRDLAARNILLTQNRQIAKISDFGLCRPLGQLVDFEDTQMPTAWLPPEAILHKEYSTATDVWSFGVLMWEIFSLGMFPYPGEEQFGFDFAVRLYRYKLKLPKPQMASDDIYQLILMCCEPNTDLRTTITPVKLLVHEELDSYDSQFCEQLRMILQSHVDHSGCTDDSIFYTYQLHISVKQEGRYTDWTGSTNNDSNDTFHRQMTELGGNM